MATPAPPEQPAAEPAEGGEDAAFNEKIDAIYRRAAEACVEVSEWNHVYVRLEAGPTAGPPERVDVFSWESGDDDLRECLIGARAGRASRSLVWDRFRQARQGRLRGDRPVPRALAVAHPADRAGLRPGRRRGRSRPRGGARRDGAPRPAVPAADGAPRRRDRFDPRRPRVRGVGRLGFGFARDPFCAGISVGAGASAIGEASPTALVVPVELRLDTRERGAGLLAWVRNTFSPAEERADGAEHATLDATALQLGTGFRVPVLWRGGLILGIRYDERLGEQRLGVWLGTEWRARRF